MKFGCKSKIPFNFMAATIHVIAKILWKPFCGNFEQGHLGVIFLMTFAHGKQPTTVSIVVPAKDCGRIFFKLRGILDKEWVFIDGSYIRAHQHASGARRGEDRAIGRYQEVEQLQRFTLPSMRMDIRLILKSLGVKSTTVKLQVT